MTALSVVNNDVPLGFPGLMPQDSDAIARYFRRIDLRPNETLFHEGQTGDFMCVIGLGRIAITVAGKEIARLAQGQIVGEMSLLDNWTRSATCTAVARSVVFALDSAALRLIVRDHPAIAARMLTTIAGTLARRLRKTDAPVANALWKEQAARSAPDPAAPQEGG